MGSKQWGWSCSECYPDSSDDDPEKQIVIDFDEASDGLNRRRRQRRQAAASKALQMASSSDEEDNREIMKKVKKESIDDNRKVIKKVKKEPLAAAPSSTSAQQQLQNFTAQLTKSVANSNGLDEKRDDLIARAEAKAERKRKRREEKAKRKAEKKAQKKRIIEAQNGNNSSAMLRQNEEDTDESDIEIIEDDNGVCTVSIQPRPIKLTIKTNGHPKNDSPASTSNSALAKSASGKDSRSKC